MMRLRDISIVLLAGMALAGCGGMQPPAAASVTNTPVVVAPTPAPAITSLPRVPGVRYAGGDGSTLEQAVVVLAGNSNAGIRAEYVWLAERHPGYRRISQTLLHSGGKPYDMLEIELPDQRRIKVYFEISRFFGRF